MKYVIVVIAAVFLSGCMRPNAVQQTPTVVRPENVVPEWTQVATFSCGDAVIRLGMTADQVLAEIGQSSRYGVLLGKPTPKMLEEGVWVLSSGGDTAPGFVSVRIIFRNGVVVKLENYTGPVPA